MHTFPFIISACLTTSAIEAERKLPPLGGLAEFYPKPWAKAGCLPWVPVTPHLPVCFCSIAFLRYSIGTIYHLLVLATLDWNDLFPATLSRSLALPLATHWAPLGSFKKYCHLSFAPTPKRFWCNGSGFIGTFTSSECATRVETTAPKLWSPWGQGEVVVVVGGRCLTVPSRYLIQNEENKWICLPSGGLDPPSFLGSKLLKILRY